MAPKKSTAPIEPRFPSDRKLKELLKTVKSAEADKNEAVGRKGGLIASAVDKDHLDKKAWAWLCQAERMSALKGSTTLNHFLHYVAVLGLEERWKQQAEMFAREQTDPALRSARKEPEPLPGSFAEKVRQAKAAAGNGTGKPAPKPRRARKPKTIPVPAEVEATAPEG